MRHYRLVYQPGREMYTGGVCTGVTSYRYVLQWRTDSSARWMCCPVVKWDDLPQEERDYITAFYAT
jgi:hypothetical protein